MDLGWGRGARRSHGAFGKIVDAEGLVDVVGGGLEIEQVLFPCLDRCGSEPGGGE